MARTNIGPAPAVAVAAGIPERAVARLPKVAPRAAPRSRGERKETFRTIRLTMSRAPQLL